MCFQLTHFPCDDWENLHSVSYHHQIGSVNYYPLFRARSWNNGMRCMSLYSYGNIGHIYVTSRYSTRIFYRGVSDFATDCPCGVWCRGSTTCLLYVGPLFGNRLLNNSWAVGLIQWTVNLHYVIGILTYVIVYVLIHHTIFWLYLYILNSVLYHYQVLMYKHFP